MELAVFIISIIVAFALSKMAGTLLAGWLEIPREYGPALGFILVWFLVQLILSLTKGFLSISIPDSLQNSKWNKFSGIAASFLRGSVFIMLILLFITVMPVSSTIRSVVSESSIGGLMVSKGGFLDIFMKKYFGSEADEIVKFLTVNPFKNDAPTTDQTGRILKPTESLTLGYKTTKVRVDPASEGKMLELVNKARQEEGLPALIFSADLQALARAHARDMFARGYFSHINPDKIDPFQRMVEAGIDYQTAGENLALAPNVELAHTGLMNSPGHRANILESRFGHVGIGVIDGGVYGKMFVQEFKN